VSVLLPAVFTIFTLAFSLIPSLVRRLPRRELNLLPTLVHLLGLRAKRDASHDLTTRTPLRVLSSFADTLWSLSQSTVDGLLGLSVLPEVFVTFAGCVVGFDVWVVAWCVVGFGVWVVAWCVVGFGVWVIAGCVVGLVVWALVECVVGFGVAVVGWCVVAFGVWVVAGCVVGLVVWGVVECVVGFGVSVVVAALAMK
jgi:hypothetical protein